MMNSGCNLSRILLVEDEPPICEVCLEVLAGEGYQVETAANGRMAKSKLKEKQFDLVIIELRTAAMSGGELYKHIGDNYPQLLDRVLFTTGNIISDHTRSFLEATGSPYLAKPFTPDELRTMVRERLGAGPITGKQGK